MSEPRQRAAWRIGVALAGSAVVCLIAAGCQPEPAPTASPGTTETSAPSPSATTASPTPTPTAAAAFELPTACEEIYSADMLDSLNAQIPPLNDPGVTMLSSQNAGALEVLESGIPTIRCSWGTPSERGMATNVTVVGAAQSAAVEQSLIESGFGCEPLGAGTICRVEQPGVTLDDEEYVLGETHYLQGEGWVSTAWLNVHPDGYTEDIVATLWG